jgi:hypothetical protein
MDERREGKERERKEPNENLSQRAVDMRENSKMWLVNTRLGTSGLCTML